MLHRRVFYFEVSRAMNKSSLSEHVRLIWQLDITYSEAWTGNKAIISMRLQMPNLQLFQVLQRGEWLIRHQSWSCRDPVQSPPDTLPTTFYPSSTIALFRKEESRHQTLLRKAWMVSFNQRRLSIKRKQAYASAFELTKSKAKGLRIPLPPKFQNI